MNSCLTNNFQETNPLRNKISVFLPRIWQFCSFYSSETHWKVQSILEAILLGHGAKYCYLFRIFPDSFSLWISPLASPVSEIVSSNLNPFLSEPAVRREWLMVMENINTLRWIELRKKNEKIRLVTLFRENKTHLSIKFER